MEVKAWMDKHMNRHTYGWLVEHGLTSHSTQFRSFRRRCF